LSLLISPFVVKVVTIEPEPDMLAEREGHARMADIDNVRFVTGGSDDLPALRSSLGLFRATLPHVFDEFRRGSQGIFRSGNLGPVAMLAQIHTQPAPLLEEGTSADTLRAG
jgi:hypothetical protein